MINLLDFKHTNLIPFLESGHGAGKTQFVQQVASTNNMGLFTLNLAAIESSDFTGMPYIDKGITKYARPAFKKCKYCICKYMGYYTGKTTKRCNNR